MPSPRSSAMASDASEKMVRSAEASSIATEHSSTILRLSAGDTAKSDVAAGVAVADAVFFAAPAPCA
jgi:hypothetical protein